MRWLLVGLLGVSACATHASAPLWQGPQVIRILADVKDDARLCVVPTSWMLFESPLQTGVLCETVGELRDRLLRQRAAN